MSYVSPTEHIKDLLVTAGIGVFGADTGWRIGIARMTDQPDTQICIYDAPGERPNPKWLLDYPYVQILVRGAPDSYQAARSKCQDVYDALLGADPRVTASGDRIDAITGVSSPNYIGGDKLNRPILSTNFRIILEPVASALTNREPL